MIRKHKYVLEPDVDKFKGLANYFYFLKNDFNPIFRQLFIQSYYNGTVNYCWSLYWLRSSVSDIRKVRYYYMCCLGSILGFSINETVGASCLSNQSVSENNENFLKLIDFVGMSSLHDIAIVSARSILRQIHDVKPDYFKMSSTRSSTIDDKSLPKTVHDEYKNTILEELLNLAHTKTRLEENPRIANSNKFLNVYESCIKTVFKSSDEDDEYSNMSVVYEMYTNMCRSYFNILDENERRLQFLIPCEILVENKECKVFPPLHSTTDDSKLDSYCLICGKDLSDSIIYCNLEGCNFGAHSKCIDILVDSNEFIFEPDSFCCNSLIKNGKALELTSNQVTKYNLSKKSISHKQFKRILEPKRRNIICYKAKFKRLRYLYDQKICEFCDSRLSLYETDHLLCNCSAFRTDPYRKKRCINFSDRIFIGRHFELAKLRYKKSAAENYKVA